MFFDGLIHISYLGIDLSDAICGLSAGDGLSVDYFETDLSGAGACGPRPPIAEDAEYDTPIGAALLIDLGRIG